MFSQNVRRTWETPHSENKATSHLLCVPLEGAAALDFSITDYCFCVCVWVCVGDAAAVIFSSSEGIMWMKPDGSEQKKITNRTGTSGALTSLTADNTLYWANTEHTHVYRYWTRAHTHTHTRTSLQVLNTELCVFSGWTWMQEIRSPQWWSQEPVGLWDWLWTGLTRFCTGPVTELELYTPRHWTEPNTPLSSRVCPPPPPLRSSLY